MATTVTVTRSELALGDLTINDNATYRLLGGPFDAGTVTWRRELVRSAYVDGAVEVGSVLDAALARMQVLVFGTSHAALQANVDALLDAFKQSAYTLTVNVDGTVWAWTCSKADYAVDFSAAGVARKRTTVTLAFPRSPTPSSGPY